MAIRSAIRTGTLALLVLLAGVSLTHAQTVSSTDIQRLQDMVYDVQNEIGRSRSRDASSAERLQTELDELRDEVIYLKVKMRKESNVSRSEYSNLRDRLEDLRSRAAGRSTSAPPIRNEDTSPRATGTTGRDTTAPPNTVPVDTELDVRLQTALSSETAQVEDRFEATTAADLYQGDNILIPAGSTVRGVVTSVDRATRTDRTGKLTLSFDQITVRGRTHPIRATVTEALQSEGIRGEVARIGTGAGVGAIIGGILGGVKGAMIGILVGAGGTVAATEGEDVDLEAGTLLRIRFDQPVTIRN